MSDAWAMRAGRLFDGEAFVDETTVVVRDGTVVELTREAPGLPLTDLGDDVTLMPGLVDAHVHLSFDASFDLVAGFAVDDEQLLERMRESAAITLAAGVTTVRDLGDRSFLAARLGRELADLTVLAAGAPLTTPGGHCYFLGGEVADRAQMLAAVNARAEAGCSVVKVMVSGGNITPGSLPWEAQFEVEDLRAIVEEAHRLGMRTAGHVHGVSSVAAALDAGFDTLEHVTFMTPDGIDPQPDLLKRIVDTGTVISATAGSTPGAVPPPAIAARLALVRDMLGQLHADGGRMIVGTDAGVGPGKPHGVLPNALRDLVDAGIASDVGLAMMTSLSADALGLAGTKGSLTAGADADLLAVRGDPTADAEAMLDVVGVWARGARVR
ncbi:MAG: Xaa-Pro dipeptidase [Frankiales bacterium]|nr:Xaa-Pro dipeptidase [Frankiales bacterium]